MEAQTLANVYLAVENDLEIILVLNKTICRQPSRSGSPRRSSKGSA